MHRLALLFSLILLIVIASHVEGRGGSRGGGERSTGRSSALSSGRGGEGRGAMSSSRSTYSSMSRRRYSRGVKKTTNKKSPHSVKPSKKRMMKKAVLVGVGAYSGHKLTKVSSKFKKHNFIRGHSSQISSWRSGDWRRAVSIDNEFLCRSNTDCSWLDDDLECDEVRIDFEPSQIWFGGDSVSIRGKCQCQDMFWWDDDQLQCQMFWEGDDFVEEDTESFGMPWWLDLILAIVAVVVMYVCYFLCCSE